MPPSQPKQNRNFDQLQASLLHCPKCKRAVQVRERLLLVLPDGQLFEYRCVHCGSSIGERTEKNSKPAKIIL
ncbi:MAG: cytoplasmic protein [Nitrospirae bacterium]|nr:cytoplasmic protein [Nitrospirota bacterium]MBI3594958.1 cytoplasmic protein [Nitrospirota bacterium]